MRNPDWRGAYEAMYEGTEQDGPEPTAKQRRMAMQNIRQNKNRLSHEDPDSKKTKQELAFQKARAKAWGMKEETELSEEGKKDACYHKVKSRYSVWPSAYASGALVKCRKKGAKNWGNSAKKEDLEMVFAFLINEGFAITEDDALAIIEGMSENWYDMILEDLTEEFG